MNAEKWECDALNNNDGIFLMHNGRSQAAKPIYHDSIMIAYIAHGEGTHHCNGKDEELKEGDVLIVNPDVVHYFSSSPRFRYLELYYCFISSQKASTAYLELKHDFPELQRFFDNSSLKYLHIKDNEKKELRNLFIHMIDEFMNCPPGHKSLVNSYLMIMLGKIFRRYLFSMNNPVFNRNKTVDEAIRYINYNLSFGVKVCDISEALHLSEEYLCRLFKKHTGVTIKQFITNLKIEKVKDLLENTNRSIESIAVSLNCNQVYLNRLFKKHTDMTLLEYRKKYHYKV